MKKKASVPSILFFVVVIAFIFNNNNEYTNLIAFWGGLIGTMGLYSFLEEKFYK